MKNTIILLVLCLTTFACQESTEKSEKEGVKCLD